MSRRSLEWVTQTPFAHRGLHDEETGLVENTCAAFEAAFKSGYGIELDLQLSADGEAMVFHDASLNRLTFTSGAVASFSAADLIRLPLKNTTERIPTLETVLRLVKGRVPLLIEIKSLSRSTNQLEPRTAELLSEYEGPFGVQSFNPYSMAWFRENAPDMVRGQISTDYFQPSYKQLPWAYRFTFTHLLHTSLSRPDFIAFDASALPRFAPTIARRLGLPLITWTVKSADEWAELQQHADNLIFEGFRP